MNEATQVLRNEHEVILKVLEATETLAESLEGGADVPPQVLNNIIEFLKLFADRQHHRKEEDLLFPELEKKGMPRAGGPVGMMLMEHQAGRSLIAQMANAANAYAEGDRQAGAHWADAALNYVALLQDHIAKENNILFVMAERLLTPAEQQQLAAKFDGVDKQKMGEGERERLLRLADSVLKEVSVLSQA